MKIKNKIASLILATLTLTTLRVHGTYAELLIALKSRKCDAASVSRDEHAQCEKAPGTVSALCTMLKTATGIELPEVRVKALTDVAWSAFEIDSDLAREACQQLPGRTEKIRLIQHYAIRVAEKNPGKAVAWATKVDTWREIATAKRQISLALEPPHAANLLSESGIIGREFDVTVIQVLRRWAVQSAPDANA